MEVKSLGEKVMALSRASLYREDQIITRQGTNIKSRKDKRQ